MKIRDIAEVIERYAPLRLQESYDNAGLIVGRPEDEVHQALLEKGLQPVYTDYIHVG